MLNEEGGAPTVYLLDGFGFLFRGFYALPPLTTPDGVPIGSIVGFCNMILKFLQQYRPQYCAVALDTGEPTFRHDLCESYKKNRMTPPDDLIPQFSIMREACEALALPILETKGVEADDLMATYAELAVAQGFQVVLVSSDKDLMQLVRPGIRLYDPMKDKMFTEETVQEVWGVPPEKIPHVQALMGDSSDNIQGIPGIGPKTACQWIQQFGSVEGVIHAATTCSPKEAGCPFSPAKKALVQEYADVARKCYQLAYLHRHVPLSLSLEELRLAPPVPSVMQTFFQRYHLKNVAQRFSTFFHAVPQPRIKERKILEVSHIPQYARHIQEQGRVALFFPPFVNENPSLFHHGAWPWSGVGLATHEGEGVWLSLDTQEAQSFFFSVLHSPDVVKIFSDSKAFLHQMESFFPGKTVMPPFEDVCVLRHVAEGGHAVKDLEDTEVFASILAQKDAPMEDIIPLCAAGLFLLWTDYTQTIVRHKNITVYETLEKPLIPILFSMESKGILLDIPYLESLSVEFSQRLLALEQRIYEETNTTFNVASPKQLGEVLCEKLKWPPKGKKGKGGSYPTSSDVLTAYAHDGYGLATTLLEWRQISKLYTTYVVGLLKQVSVHNPYLSTRYSMTTTSTGRLSSVHPNVQNIPVRTEEGKKIRHAFMARPGCVLVSLDYSNIELRILAHLGHVKALQDAFLRGEDVHALTAHHIFGDAAMTEEHRRQAKILNFGIIYGISAFGLSQQLGISHDMAKEYIHRHFLLYPEAEALAQTYKKQAKEQGYVTTMWGRRCTIATAGSSRAFVAQAAERQAINAPIQGTSADIMKRAMIHVARMVPKHSSLLIQVHDELIVEIPEEHAASLAPRLCTVMENAAHLSVPLHVRQKSFHRWQ